MNPETPKGYGFEDIARTETAVRIKYLLDHHLMQNIDAGDAPKDVARGLLDAFLFSYDYAHRDHTQMRKKDAEGRVFRVKDMDDGQVDKLKEVFREFAKKYYPDGSMSPELCDKFPAAVEWLYRELVTQGPLANAEFIVGAMLVEIGRGKKAGYKQGDKGLFPDGIDFSRADSTTRDNEKKLKVRAAEAISNGKIEASTPPWDRSEDSSVEIGGLHFLGYKTDGKSYLVTQSGTLVRYEPRGLVERDILKYLQSGGDGGGPGNPDKVPVTFFGNPNPPQLFTYVHRLLKQPGLIREDGSETSRYRSLTALCNRLDRIAHGNSIDGVKRDECGMRLVCADVDLLTGLRMDGGNNELARFTKFLASRGINEIADLIPPDYSVNTLTDGQDKKRPFLEHMRTQIAHRLQELKKDAPEDIQVLIDKAEPSLCLQLPQRVYVASDRLMARENGKIAGHDEYKRKEAPEKKIRAPRYYSVQGGMASAKTRLHDFARYELGEDEARNLVIASLDDARPEADQYHLYIAAGHHGDDYHRIEQFGKAIRSLTQKRALAGGLDFLMDGTGIPFEGRYENMARSFKEAGYETTVLTATRPLYVHLENRKELEAQGISYGDAMIQRLIRRYKKLRDILPELVVATHINTPVAANDAKRSLYVDRQITFDTSVANKEEKILSYTMDIGKEHPLKKLLGKENEQLLHALNDEGLIPKEWGKKSKRYSSGLLPEGRLTGFKVIRDDGHDHYRIEVITDMEKYKGPDLLEKGLFNKDAKGPGTLYQHTLAFDMLGEFQEHSLKKTLGGGGPDGPPTPNGNLSVDYDSLKRTRTRPMNFLASASQVPARG